MTPEETEIVSDRMQSENPHGIGIAGGVILWVHHPPRRTPMSEMAQGDWQLPFKIEDRIDPRLVTAPAGSRW